MLIQLYGGLGNQLFQIFSLMGISSKNNYDYLIDKNHNPGTKMYWNNILSQIPNCENIDNLLENNDLFTVNETRFSQYCDIVLSKNDFPNVLLKGYFQSFYYFDHIRDNVFDILIKKQNPQILNKVNDIYKKFKLKYPNKQFIFIHRRKGDYNDPKHQNFYRILPMDYYKEALKHFNQDECVFFIFCEEQISTLEEFDFLKNKEFIIEDDYIELLLMSKMDGAIIANSTFSLWGAYLMDYYRCKKIVCPKYFFAEWDIHRYDCFEKHWVFIENQDMFRDIKVDPQRK
jgi:hypothetical protein